MPRPQTCVWRSWLAMMTITHKCTALPYEQGNRSHPCLIVLRTQSHDLSNEDSLWEQKSQGCWRQPQKSYRLWLVNLMRAFRHWASHCLDTRKVKKKKPTWLNLKMGRWYDKLTLLKEEMQMAHKYMEENAQWSPEKCKSKVQWNNISALLGWLLSVKQKVNAGKEVDENGTFKHLDWCSHYGGISKKNTENRSNHITQLFTSGIYTEKMKSAYQRDTCPPMITAALLTIAKIWNRPSCPSTDEWTEKMYYICM